MLVAMTSVIAENNGVSPFKIWSDEGAENLSLKDFWDEMEIIRYSTNSPIKAAYSEHVNKLLQNRLYKVMTAKSTAKWIDLLPDVTTAYNNTPTKKLRGMTPIQAHDPKNEEILRSYFLEDYGKHKRRFAGRKARFAVGDGVRILEKRTKFSRGYTPNFSSATFKVREVIPSYPITYKLTGKQRSFYSQELVKAVEPETEREKLYFIERTRVVNAKKLRSGALTGGQTEYLLKAKNNPDQSSWITHYEYRKLRDDDLL
jgi:hypothetical protein